MKLALVFIAAVIAISIVVSERIASAGRDMPAGFSEGSAQVQASVESAPASLSTGAACAALGFVLLIAGPFIALPLITRARAKRASRRRLRANIDSLNIQGSR